MSVSLRIINDVAIKECTATINRSIYHLPILLVVPSSYEGD